jgi:hypothetical protein
MGFLFVSMAVEFLLLTGKNDERRFVQTVPHMVALESCLGILQMMVWLDHWAINIQIQFVLTR